MQYITEQATDTQIAEWKKQYGDVFEISVSDDDTDTYVYGYFKKPSRQVIANAARFAAENPVKAAEITFNGCAIAVYKEMETDNELFFPSVAKLSGITQAKEAEIKKF